MTEDQEKEFMAYLKQYGSKYPDNVLYYIEHCYREKFKEGENINVFGQIFNKLGFIEDNRNVYKYYLDIAKQNVKIDQNTLEIGCGFWPIFAEYFAEEQKKVGKGSITAFDKFLVVDNLPGINLHRRNFEESDDASHYSLFIGISPCDGAKLLIKKAHEANGELLLALCQCYYPEDCKYISEKSLISEQAYELIELAEKTKPDNNEIIIIEDIGCEGSFPVILSKRKTIKTFI